MAAQFFSQPLDLTHGSGHRFLLYNLTRKQRSRAIPTYRNAVLIYNPRAGRLNRGGASLVEEAVAALRALGHAVEARPTTGPRTAGAMAREAVAQGADLVLAAGGDGTINETAEGMLHSTVPLAILPAGTANVLACEMRINSWSRAVGQLAESEPRRIAVGRLSSEAGVRHFLLMAGIGLDAHIVYNVDAGLKSRTGKLAYWVAGWSLVGRALPEFHAEIDGRDRRCSFALAARVRNYGGDFEIARETTLFDDEFEIVLFEGRSTARYVKYFVGMAANRLRGMSGVTVLRARSVEFSRPGDPGVYVQLDGEFAGRLPARVEIVPDALTLMVPDRYAALSDRGRERQQEAEQR